MKRLGQYDRPISSVNTKSVSQWVELPPPADACSCMVPVLERSIEAAEFAFIGTQIDRIEESSHVILVVEVDEVFKGELGDTVELRTGRGGGDCGVSFASSGSVGILAFSSTEDGYPRVSSCSSIWTSDALRYAFEPLVSPQGKGPPAFYAPTGVGGSRGVLLDDLGLPLGYAYGEGHLIDGVFCPGGEMLVEAAEAAESAGWRGDNSAPRPEIVVRNVSTMNIVASYPVASTDGEDSRSPEPWLLDLDCHTPGGGQITYATVSRFSKSQDPVAAASIGVDPASITPMTVGQTAPGSTPSTTESPSVIAAPPELPDDPDESRSATRSLVAVLLGLVALTLAVSLARRKSRNRPA